MSRRVVEKIVVACEGCASALEIGPGGGVLTSPLSAQMRVVAVEADGRMATVLAETAPSAELIIEDALRADLPAIVATLERPVALVSNMPYSITGPLLGRVCELALMLDRAVLMMQREVAERAVASAGDRRRGSLTVALEARFDIEVVAQAPPGAFDPPPKVSSTVLLFRPHGRVEVELLPTLDRVVKAAFRQPRKTLANNLGRPVDGLDPKIRPHQLGLEQFLKIARTYLN